MVLDTNKSCSKDGQEEVAENWLKIIARFERRSGEPVNWDTFAGSVAVQMIQMNDIHPTLCIPELMRILMDLKRFEREGSMRDYSKVLPFMAHRTTSELNMWDGRMVWWLVIANPCSWIIPGLLRGNIIWLFKRSWPCHHLP